MKLGKEFAEIAINGAIIVNFAKMHHFRIITFDSFMVLLSINSPLNDFCFHLSVLKCVDVVKSCLENDATINITARFYSFLNESVVDDGLLEHSDWKKFMDVSLMLMGYPERLRKTVLTVCTLCSINIK